MAKPINVADYCARAQRRLPRFIWDTIEGGACDEITLRRNRTAFSDYVLRPRPLVDVSRRDLTTSVLGTKISLASGSPTEEYYCTTASNTLQDMGSYSSPPSPYNCSGAGNASMSPGDYISVTVNYSFKPLFGGLSFASTQTLTATGIQRLQ